jgi:hypothetical protein
MEKIKVSWARRILKILMWVFLFLVGLYVVAVIARVFYLLHKTKTDAETNVQVEKIHNTKLTLDDVMGKNLPPDPGALADQTIAGVDANGNGIRDDVELAVFKAYPDSAKTRAVLLQYALLLQTEATSPILNKETATTASEEYSRAYDCIGTIVPESNNDIQKIQAYIDFVDNVQLNTKERKEIKTNFDNQTGSFELQRGCDIDLSTLPN